jgi:nicotinamide mononucleotide adenylyltransferase
MQVTTLVTTVDFFPEAFIAEAHDTKGMIVTVKRFQKRVTFNSNGLKSYSTVTALSARNEWDTRIANGAEVTGYNLEQMPRSEYTPMAVG